MPRLKAFDQNQALERAMELFWERGYEATALPDLMARMGIGRQSLYDTFGDKHTLYLAALERYTHGPVRTLLEPLGQRLPLRERLQAVFDHIVDEATSDPCHKGCFLANATLERGGHDEKVACLTSKAIEDTVRAFELALFNAQASGELAREKDPRALAHFFVNAIQGLRILGKTTPNRAALNDVVQVTLSVL